MTCPALDLTANAMPSHQETGRGSERLGDGLSWLAAEHEKKKRRAARMRSGAPRARRRGTGDPDRRKALGGEVPPAETRAEILKLVKRGYGHRSIALRLKVAEAQLDRWYLGDVELCHETMRLRNGGVDPRTGRTQPEPLPTQDNGGQEEKPVATKYGPDALKKAAAWRESNPTGLFRDLADELGVTVETVSVWRSQHPEFKSATDRPSKPPPPERGPAPKPKYSPEVLKLAEEYCTKHPDAGTHRIAKALGIAQTTVVRWIRKHPKFAKACGVKPKKARPSGGPKKDQEPPGPASRVKPEPVAAPGGDPLFDLLRGHLTASWKLGLETVRLEQLLALMGEMAGAASVPS